MQHYPNRWHVVIGPMLARCRVANRWRTLVGATSARRRVADRRRCQPIADVCRRRADVPLLTGLGTIVFGHVRVSVRVQTLFQHLVLATI